MKVKIDQSKLLSLLSRTQNIIEKRNTMPVLANVLLEARNGVLKIFATDLEVSVTDEMSCEILEEGKAAINSKGFFDIIKELPNKIISLEKQPNHWIKIKQNKSEFNIVGINPEEYPVFPTYSTENFIRLNARWLSDMIEKTIYSVSFDPTRYHLNGVYLEKFVDSVHPVYRMVATDGHRLSLVDKMVENATNSDVGGVIIPRKGLNEIKKLIESSDEDFEMAIEGVQLIVRNNSTVLMIRLIEGSYPNYSQLIPQNLTQKVKMKKETLQSILKRVSLLSNQKSKGVTFSLAPGKMEITSHNPELGDAKEEMEVEYQGNGLKIGFNAKYIIDILNTIETEDVCFELNDKVSPGVLRPSGDTNYTCVVMPMRI